MNRYGAMVWNHWERHRPNELEAIPDPARYFRGVGEFVDTEVNAETDVRLTRPRRPTQPG